MKKLLAVVLAGILTISMAACSGKTETSENGANKKQETETQTDQKKTESGSTDRDIKESETVNEGSLKEDSGKEDNGKEDSGAEDAKVGFYLGYNDRNRSEDFHISVAEGLKESAELEGWTYEEVVNDGDATKMVQNVQSFITKDADIVVDFSCVAETGAEITKMCTEAGIPVISVDTVYDGAYFFGVDNYGSGTDLGNGTIPLVEEYLDGKVNWIVCLYASFASDEVNSRIDGCVDVLTEKYKVPGENIIWLDCGVDDVKTATLTRDWLSAHPDDENIVFIGQTDDRGYAINTQVGNEGRTEDCIIVSYNADPSAIEEFTAQAEDGLKSAWVGSIAFSPAKYGKQIVEYAKRILAGEDVEKEVYCETLVVTKENVLDYVNSQ